MVDSLKHNDSICYLRQIAAQWSNMLFTVDSTKTQWSNMLSTIDSTQTQWPNILSTVDRYKIQWS